MVTSIGFIVWKILVLSELEGACAQAALVHLSYMSSLLQRSMS